MVWRTYTTVLIALYLLGFATTEPALINQVGEFLFHEIVDQGDGLFKAFLVCARYVEIERGVLGGGCALVIQIV